MYSRQCLMHLMQTEDFFAEHIKHFGTAQESDIVFGY